MSIFLHSIVSKAKWQNVVFVKKILIKKKKIKKCHNEQKITDKEECDLGVNTSRESTYSKRELKVRVLDVYFSESCLRGVLLQICPTIKGRITTPPNLDKVLTREIPLPAPMIHTARRGVRNTPKYQC